MADQERRMTTWTRFEDRLPSKADANKSGEIELAERNGNIRQGLWDWISPTNPQAKALWERYDFIAWRSAK